MAVFLFKFRLDFYFIILKIPVLSKALQSRSHDIFLANSFCFIVHTAVKANYTVISSSAYPFYLCGSTSQNIFGIFTFSADGSNKHNGIIFLLRKRKMLIHGQMHKFRLRQKQQEKQPIQHSCNSPQYILLQMFQSVRYKSAKCRNNIKAANPQNE